MKCVWMLAGFVDYKLCDLGYDCERCEFDRAVRRRTRMASLPRARHSAIWRQMPDRFSVGGYEISGFLFYVTGHIWVRVEGDARVRIGLDDFGQKLVGRIYSVVLPAPGTRVGPRSRSWRVIHRAGEATLRIPIRGVVREVNERLLQEPSLANRDPYGEGGAILIEPKSLAECLRGAYYSNQVIPWYRRQIDKLERELQKGRDDNRTEVGVTSPDGGTPIEDLTRAVSPQRLRSIIRMFLSAPPGCRSDSAGGMGGVEVWKGGEP